MACLFAMEVYTKCRRPYRQASNLKVFLRKKKNTQSHEYDYVSERRSARGSDVKKGGRERRLGSTLLSPDSHMKVGIQSEI